jgi:MFS family permease
VACSFIFASFCLLGQTLYGLGPLLTSISPKSQFIVMFVGRFIFGLGGGSITIVQNTITAKWFAGKELLDVSARPARVGTLFHA